MGDIHRWTSGYKSLIQHVIILALNDLASRNYKTKNEAIAFLQSSDCEYMCYAIGMNYNDIRTINWINPSETINFYIHNIGRGNNQMK